jgi:hypothetical protein
VRPHRRQNNCRLLEYNILHSCSMQSCSKGTSQHNGKPLWLSSYQSLGTRPPHELTFCCPISLVPIISKGLIKLFLKILLPIVEKK